MPVTPHDDEHPSPALMWTVFAAIVMTLTATSLADLAPCIFGPCVVRQGSFVRCPEGAHVQYEAGSFDCIRPGWFGRD